jgi:hypothetical protein
LNVGGQRFQSVPVHVCGEFLQLSQQLTIEHVEREALGILPFHKTFHKRGGLLDTVLVRPRAPPKESIQIALAYGRFRGVGRYLLCNVKRNFPNVRLPLTGIFGRGLYNNGFARPSKEQGLCNGGWGRRRFHLSLFGHLKKEKQNGHNEEQGNSLSAVVKTNKSKENDFVYSHK